MSNPYYIFNNYLLICDIYDPPTDAALELLFRGIQRCWCWGIFSVSTWLLNLFSVFLTSFLKELSSLNTRDGLQHSRRYQATNASAKVKHPMTKYFSSLFRYFPRTPSFVNEISGGQNDRIVFDAGYASFIKVNNNNRFLYLSLSWRKKRCGS